MNFDQESIMWALPPDHQKLTLDELHIWYAALDSFHLNITDLRELLSKQEDHRGRQFVTPVLRQRFWASHAILRWILAQYLLISPNAIEFYLGHHGKPYVTPIDRPLNIQFNMSHSQDHAIYIIALDDEVGIDIEYMANNIEGEDLAKRFFSSAEYQYLMSFPPMQRKSIFYWLWTRKEAYVKALGEGLSDTLKTFDVSSDRLDRHELFLHSFCPVPNYAGALATKNRVSQRLFFRVPHFVV